MKSNDVLRVDEGNKKYKSWLWFCTLRKTFLSIFPAYLYEIYVDLYVYVKENMEK